MKQEIPVGMKLVDAYEWGQRDQVQKDQATIIKGLSDVFKTCDKMSDELNAKKDAEIRRLREAYADVIKLLESIKRYALDPGNKDLVINGDACEAIDILTASDSHVNSPKVKEACMVVIDELSGMSQEKFDELLEGAQKREGKTFDDNSILLNPKTFAAAGEAEKAAKESFNESQIQVNTKESE